MSKVTMPKPLRLRWNKYTGRYDISEDHRAAGDADLITTTQAEAYADARVRQALEEAYQSARDVEASLLEDRLQHVSGPAAANYVANRIRALIPPTKNEAKE